MISESTPLLAEHSLAPPVAVARPKIPIPFRLVPIISLFAFGGSVSALSIVELIRRALCSLWYIIHEPEQLPPTDDQCISNGPVSYFNLYLAIESLIMAIGAFVLSSLIARFASQFGRKPVFISLQLGQILATTCFLTLFYIPDGTIAYVMLLLWFILASFFSVFGVLLLANLFILDVTEPSTRASFLAIATGAYQAGTAPSYFIGGLIQHHYGNAAVVYTSFFASLLGLLYTLTPLVPETFGKDKREAAGREREVRRRNARDRSLNRWEAASSDRMRGPKRAVRKTWEGVLTVFDPLTRLKPVRNSEGRINFRLTVIGLAWFTCGFGVAYIGPALIAFMTVHLRNGPDENGVVLTALAIASIIGLTVIFPLESVWGRKIYSAIHSSPPSSAPTSSKPSKSASHFEVYLLMFNLSVYAMVFVAVGMATSNTFLLIPIAMSAFGIGAHPLVVAVGVASVDPIVSGDIAAALEMVNHSARFLAPLVFGWISAKTSVSHPTLVFNIMGVLMLVSASILLLVRDEDRWIPPPADSEDVEQ